MQRGTYVDPAAAKITLRQYADSWLQAQTFDDATRDSQERRLRLHVYPVLGGKALGQLAAQPSAIQAWVRGLARSAAADTAIARTARKGLADTTARGVLTTLSMVMNAAVDDGLISRNPCASRSVRAPRPPDRKVVPWTAGQVSAVREALPARYRATADVGRWLGLRQGEAFGKAGIAVSRESGFHALRHYFASTLLYDGVDIRALAAYLGHHDPAFTLRIYAHLVPDAAERMRSVIDEAARVEADGPKTAQAAR